jgi:hypothetical protein
LATPNPFHSRYLATPNPFRIFTNVMKKLEKIQLTIGEWYDAMRTPTPHRNKKKFYRKEKHKKTWKSEE